MTEIILHLSALEPRHNKNCETVALVNPREMPQHRVLADRRHLPGVTFSFVFDACAGAAHSVNTEIGPMRGLNPRAIYDFLRAVSTGIKSRPAASFC